MTTAPRLTAPAGRAAPVMGEVRRAGLVALVAVAVTLLVALLAGGTAALAGAAVGGGLALAFFGLGAVVVSAVAAVQPAASLLVALLTYVLQVAMLALAFTALRGSGLLEETLDPRWLGGTVIVATLVWTVAHIEAHVRSRQLLYDLPEHASGEPSPDRSGSAEAGAR